VYVRGIADACRRRVATLLLEPCVCLPCPFSIRSERERERERERENLFELIRKSLLSVK
jgi:predicted Zn-ribbon and HTH transcriptional regulator